MACDKKRDISKGSRIYRVWKSRCLINMRQDFKDGDVCFNCHDKLDHGGLLGMEVRVFPRTSSDTMKIFQEEYSYFVIELVEEHYTHIYMILMTKIVTYS